MKSHLVLRLANPIPAPNIPHWEPFILNKANEVGEFGNSLDAVFREYGLPIWITAEYRPASEDGFNAEEIESGLNRTYRVILRQDTTFPPGLVDQIRLHPAVDWVRRGAIAQAVLPVYSEMASTSALSDWPGALIHLPYAHAITKGRADIKVAILDTGVDLDHPEVVGRFVARKDVVDFEGLDTSSFIGDLLQADDDPEDEVGHGTHIAGIIGARGNRIAEGVCSGCRLMAVRVLATMTQNGRRFGAGLIDNINLGIKWAVDNGADVINMSLGVRHEHGGLPHADVIQYALRKGVSVIAAAGNDGTNNKYYPGALPGVLAIGAVDRDGHVAPFSSYGARISFLAPGTGILSSYRDGGYAASSGTSQAAPFVSGAVALLQSLALEHGRRLLSHQIKYLLQQTSERIDRRRHHPKGGYGIINLADAFRLLNYELGM